MRLALQRERVHDLWEEAKPILEAGIRAHDPMPEVALEIDRELYQQLEAYGALRVYTARRAGQLQGYAIFVLAPSPRRRGVLQASQDALHAGRSGHEPRTVLALLHYAEEALREEGVKLVYHSAPARHAFGRLLQRLGYRLAWESYYKEL